MSSSPSLDVFLGGLHRRVAPEGRDLDDLAAAEEDVRQAEAPPDDAAVAEEGAHVLGAGARRDVEVLGLAAEQQVADAAADEVGLVAAALEPADDLGGVGVDAVVVERDVVADEARPGVALAAASRGARCAASCGGGLGRRPRPCTREGRAARAGGRREVRMRLALGRDASSLTLRLERLQMPIEGSHGPRDGSAGAAGLAACRSTSTFVPLTSGASVVRLPSRIRHGSP